MSNGIRGRPPGPGPTDLPRPAGEDAKAKDTAAAKAPATAATPETSAGSEPGSLDKFERGGAGVGVQLENRLQALATAKGAQAAKIQFSSEDLQYLANTFAQIISQYPQANRLKRARLFTKAILKRKKLRKVFAGVPEQEMEQMCDLIGDVLDSSPVFGQLVDNVSDEAGKNS